jgi:hypothetical protein
MIRRVIATSLAVMLALGAAPILLAQQGIISGKADDEAKKPYSNYSVQLMDLKTNQITATVQLDTQGQFSFNGVAPDAQYLVQLYSNQQNRVVCTEGPYTVAAPSLSHTSVNIDCDKKPAALWLLAAAAGAGVGVALATQSNSQ